MEHVTQEVKYCSAILALYGEKIEACDQCRHNACANYAAAKRDEMDRETDWEDRNG